ncbi:ribonuclease H [Candidatus Falkowbacteria bacterium HGW-Falkowbacteria-1]|jgi:ribonuclease HI|uniref:Ribonuclease H n=1 Tax=Candidatus Falkowbacteria bacterium HGW-Falkowbacteria-1 TaxID=2013768 RepID=A0A2N2E943_9BACT|nr:MAG: ribonuclease H [Candidatus Falkowbacteria bacterium HGW-Falkowbacteria-1]
MSSTNKNITIFSDGGARGNPGPAGVGAVLYNEKKEKVAEVSKYLGVATNNQAEYKALIFALEKANALGAERIEAFLDSELVVKQLNREYKVKNKDLAPLFLEVYNLSQKFKEIKFVHIPREKNVEADRLANLAMDRRA